MTANFTGKCSSIMVNNRCGIIWGQIIHYLFVEINYNIISTALINFYNKFSLTYFNQSGFESFIDSIAHHESSCAIEKTVDESKLSRKDSLMNFLFALTF